MKQIYLLLAVLLFNLLPTSAQEIRLNVYADYVFQDKFSSYFSNNAYFEGKVEDGFRWGAGIEYLIQRRTAIEIQYLRQDTKAPTTYSYGFVGPLERTNFDLGVNYIMLNSTRYIPVNEKLEPFIGGGIGMGIFNVDNPDTGRGDSGTKFSWQIRGGTNLWLNDKVGIRLQAALFSVVQAVGGGLYFGTGGPGVSLNSYSTIYQFSLGGGVVIRMK